MMMLEVIKNAEIPNGRRAAGARKRVYPFPQLKVGDGFDVYRKFGRDNQHRDRTQDIVSAAGRVYAKRHNPTAKFTVRILDENTVRCVRIA